MQCNATTLVQRQNIQVNPKTQAELEQRWLGIQHLKNKIQSTVSADSDIALIQVAGDQHAR
ncbi:hypothetical protein [Acinetobacter larvae]|uniref:Uncharacterized protein n=1 Tax=Acinetobacter larvae TaxID=1789224 RepID=A0A1B2LX38_9GAMM|nr:hypothetical protein [Acinetobacter larvae]AOA57501.1 hypothetical protein BFG52_03450 [Acinetobacter larvae]